MRVRVLGKAVPARADGAFRGIQVARFAQQMSQPGERVSRNAVSRRQRVVGHGFGPVKQGLVVVGGKEEATALPILEAGQHEIGNLHGETQIFRTPAALQQAEQGVEHEGVVVQIGGVFGSAALVGDQQAPVAPKP